MELPVAILGLFCQIEKISVKAVAGFRPKGKTVKVELPLQGTGVVREDRKQAVNDEFGKDADVFRLILFIREAG